jgi:nucleotidyltransferase/DNA polymerase involved in DNA repair
MENDKQVEATVISPAKDAHIRKGRGFSLNEIKEAGKSLEDINDLNIIIDYFRKSTHQENVQKLQNLKSEKKKSKKREPFVKKEKKRTPFKPKKAKAKKAPIKKVAPKPKKPKPKVKEFPAKKEKVKVKTTPLKVAKETTTGIPLTNLSGLGPATAEKFIQLGVSNIKDLSSENPDELGALIKGVSSDRIKKWIEEALSLIQK